MDIERIATELPSGTVLFRGRYTIVRSLAFGGAATVYAARTPDGHQVALKILDASPTQRGRLAERMKNEARIGAALHEVPNLVRPLDHGEIPELGGRPFIAFELEDARDLAFMLIAGPLAPLRACEIARSVADTLAHLHARGVIHRDVKPANIIVDERSDRLRIRLLDLGHASSIGAGALPDTRGLTFEREVTGTLEYMAPEHVLGHPAAPSFDIYALASTLWEMLIGLTPYGACRSVEVLKRKCDPDAPAPSLDRRPLASGLDPQLKALVDRGLQKDVEARVGSAIEFRDELDRIIDTLRGAAVLPFPARAQKTEPVPVADDAASTSVGAVEASSTPREAAPERPQHPRRSRAGAVALGIALVAIIVGAAALSLRPTPEAAMASPMLQSSVSAVSLAVPPGAPLLAMRMPTTDSFARQDDDATPQASEARAPAEEGDTLLREESTTVPPRPTPSSEPQRLSTSEDSSRSTHDSSRAAHDSSRSAHDSSRSAHGSSRSAHGSSRSTRETPRATRDSSRPAPSGAPREDTDRCRDARDALRRAKAQQDWEQIADATRSNSACWPESERLQLRIRALRQLGLFRACVAEGKDVSDAWVQRDISLCKARLE